MVRSAGTRRMYEVDMGGVKFWDDALAAFKASAEQQATKERKAQ
jgi:hypothetical protein